MSGQGFTTTPNLQLIKPDYAKDRGQWGNHWNANADKLDQAITAQGVGPFLPIAGGTVTGALTVLGPTTMFAGATLGTAGAITNFSSTRPYLLNASALMQGTPPASGLFGQYAFTVPADTAAAASNPRGLSLIPVQYNFGGVGFTGGRTGLNFNMSQTGPITTAVNVGFVGGNFAYFSNQPVSGGGLASGMGLSISSLLGSAATGYAFTEALEIAAGSNAPVSGRWGLTIFPIGSQQGDPDNDYAFSVGGVGTTTARWRVGYGFGRSKSPWGMDPAGSLFAANTMTTGRDGVVPWLNQTTGFGFNFPDVNFGTAAIWTSGNKVLGDGTHQIGTGAISPTATGLSIDAVGYVGSNPTISFAGSAYVAGDQASDGLGGIYVITSVSGTGAITGITLTGGRPPYSFGGPGPATAALIGGTSNTNDGVVGITWAQQRTLQLQASGGPLVLSNLPTSAAGLTAGQVWRNGTVLNIV